MAALRLIMGCAVFVALCSPALASQTCVIVYSPGTNGDWREKYWHEMAHCNGWSHPTKSNAFGEAYHPPKKYLHVYEGPLEAHKVSTAKAKAMCDGHYGCQWYQ